MHSFTADLRHAIRILVKNPGFTLIAVAALALGIGANTAIFTVVDAVLLRPLPYPDPNHIVVLQRSYRNGHGNSVSIPKFNAWTNQNQALTDICAYDFAGPGLNLAGGDLPEQVKGIHVSRNYFHLFGAAPVLGRTFLAEEDKPGGARVAVLSSGLWKRRFGGDPAMIGRAINLNGEPYTVIGILGAGFQPEPVADVWLALQPDPASVNHAHYLRVAARLKPGVSLQAANAQMKILADRFRREHPKNMDDTETAAAIPMQQELVGDVRPALLILSGAVSFVLLIACANVANLLLARATGRQREMAIRAAIGAGRGRIVRQLLTESILLAFAGGVLGLVLGFWGVRALLAVSPGNIPRIGEFAAGIHLDWAVFAFTLGVAFATGILFGLFPALQASRPDLNATLKEASGRSGTGLRQNRARGLLVVSEMALAVVLLIGATLLIRTFIGLRNVNPGVETHNILTMQTSLIGAKYSTTARVDMIERQIVQRVEAIPGVVAAAPAVTLPVQFIGLDLPFSIAGRTPPNGDRYIGDELWRFVGTRYFEVYRIGLQRGRLFNDSDSLSSLPVMLVNEAFARKYWPKDDPIGRQITIAKGLGPEFEDPVRQVVGIVANVREAGLNQDLQPIMYIPSAQVPDGLTRFANSIIPISWVVRTTVDPLSLSAAIQREFLAVDRQLPVAKILTMQSVVAESTARESFNMLLLAIFAGIALLLAAIGIYGLMSYSVEQRTNEIGIRMALGAGRGDMVKMVVKQAMGLSLTGVIAGLGAAFGLTRLLQKLLFGVKPNDPSTFAAVAVLLSAIALLAACIPAVRATRIDPVTALRYE